MSNNKIEFKKNEKTELIELRLFETYVIDQIENSSAIKKFYLKTCCPSLVNLCVPCPPKDFSEELEGVPSNVGCVVLKISKCIEINDDVWKIDIDSIQEPILGY